MKELYLLIKKDLLLESSKRFLVSALAICLIFVFLFSFSYDLGFINQLTINKLFYGSFLLVFLITSILTANQFIHVEFKNKAYLLLRSVVSKNKFIMSKLFVIGFFLLIIYFLLFIISLVFFNVSNINYINICLASYPIAYSLASILLLVYIIEYSENLRGVFSYLLALPLLIPVFYITLEFLHSFSYEFFILLNILMLLYLFISVLLSKKIF